MTATGSWGLARGTLLALAVALALAAPLALLPARAHAAKVRVVNEQNEDEEGGTFIVTTIEFKAGRKRFSGVVRRSGRRYVFIARKGSMHAGNECRRIGRRRASCRPRRHLDGFNAVLSRRGDRFAMAIGRMPDVPVEVFGEGGADFIQAPGFRPGDGEGDGFASLAGGRGDDRLVGGSGPDDLIGQGGHDKISGRGNADRIFDPAGSGRSNRDSFDGGAGRDVVSYEERGTAVRVDLAHHRGGAGRERDRIKRVEDVIGGTADDTLIGDARANSLDGLGGPDDLRGRQGDDALIGGTADFGSVDSFSGGPGDDRFRTSEFGLGDTGEQVVCGTGTDLILNSDVEDLLAPDCELAELRGTDESFGTITVSPRVQGANAVFHLTCVPSVGTRCAGSVAVEGSTTNFDVPAGESDVTVPLPAGVGPGDVVRITVASSDFGAVWRTELQLP